MQKVTLANLNLLPNRLVITEKPFIGFAYRLSHYKHLIVDRIMSNAHSWSSSDEGVDVPCGTISSTSVTSDLCISNLTRGLWMSIFSILCVGKCLLSGSLWY